MQEFFRVSPPSVHQMVLTLERAGLDMSVGAHYLLCKGKSLLRDPPVDQVVGGSSPPSWTSLKIQAFLAYFGRQNVSALD